MLLLSLVKDLEYYPRMFSDRHDDDHKYFYPKENLQFLQASLLNKLLRVNENDNFQTQIYCRFYNVTRVVLSRSEAHICKKDKTSLPMRVI